MQINNKPPQGKAINNRILIKNLQFLVGTQYSVKEEILTQIRRRKCTIILACSLNDIASSSLSTALMHSYNAVDICTTDGMPLVWWATVKVQCAIERVYGPSLMKSIICETQGDRFRHVFCGTTPSHLGRLVDRIAQIAPQAIIAGCFSPQIELKESAQERFCLRQIIDCKPSVLWIGISSPKQVVLAARWKKHFPKTTIICVGAALDIISGALKSAPPWAQSLGLEWLVRLFVEPKRLYKRYLFLIPRFLFAEAAALLKVFIRRRL